ncbi:hypothetical protein [Oscillatoria sp. FACHB-1406]|uniref:hypothetical protein n=1 Tax=Oscillatoria sp. FACHB-1406 TaxID=2692846 RepID=UPI001683FCDC|nr:hypothetical protein [Oscillatoria sp. FACHB-1406]MBD2577295.1 hypothetical protein [Oscillatoria sp. FACHB-1406]
MLSRRKREVGCIVRAFDRRKRYPVVERLTIWQLLFLESRSRPRLFLNSLRELHSV